MIGQSEYFGCGYSVGKRSISAILSKPVKEGKTTHVIDLNAVDYSSSPDSVPEKNCASSASRHAR